MNLRLFVLGVALTNSFSYAEKLTVVEQVALNPGDVIISINGKKMKNNLIAFKVLGEVKTPSKLTMEVLHDGKIKKTVYDLK